MTRFPTKWITHGDIDYSGGFHRRISPREYQFIELTNLKEACGDDAQHTYLVELRYLDIDQIPNEQIVSALRCCGQEDEAAQYIGKDKEKMDDIIAECCFSYGAYGPIWSLESNSSANCIRGAKHEAKKFLNRDAIDRALDKPVNKIGLTGREYMKGDIDSAIRRAKGPEGNLMRKLHGIQTAPIIQLKHSDILKCKFVIMVPEHYRKDGSCRCDEPEHRKMMIAEWDYSEKDFDP